MHTLIIALAQYLIIIPLLIGVVVFWRLPTKNARLTFMLEALVAAVLVLALAKLGSMLFNNPRPFVAGHFTPYFPHGNDNGFPSDHTALATAVAAVVLLWHRRAGAALLVLAVLIGTARVGAHVHHWPDIVAGLAIGVVCAALGVLAARWAVPAFSRARAAQRHTV